MFKRILAGFLAVILLAPFTTISIKASELTADYVLEALSAFDFGREFEFFLLEEDIYSQPFSGERALLEFDTLEEAKEFFQLFAKSLDYNEIATYIYDINTSALSRDWNDFVTWWAPQSPILNIAVWKNLAFNFRASPSGLVTVNEVIGSWETGISAASWTHNFGNVVWQPGHHTPARLSAQGTWLISASIAGLQVGSRHNDTWIVDVLFAR